MKLITFLEEISFKKLTGISLILTFSLMVPLSVWVVQQETKTTGQAYFEKPEVPENKEVIEAKVEYGQPSAGNPQITLVWPFLGKVGDAVLIHGNNFGDNPRDKNLIFNQQIVSEDQILRWTPDLIEFLIPQTSPKSLSEALSLNVAGKTARWDYPFTVYDLNTKTRVMEKDRLVRTLDAPPNGSFELFFGDGEKISGTVTDPVLIPEGKTVVSVMVYNQENQPLPFFAEPVEFGF